METKLLCSWVLILGITLGPSCGESRDVGRSTAAVPLGMQENSASYIFTQSNASDQLAIDYLEVERKRNPKLNEVWKCALERMGGIRPPDGLRREHLLAVYAYTDSICNNFHSDFNSAVRMDGAGDSVYAAKFPFKSVHYLLSVALARLREIAGKAPGTTYRGMSRPVILPKEPKMIFGSFTSSSLDRSIAKKYGNQTFFEIKSQFGVAIHEYSGKREEKEVLIPPFEEFEITRSLNNNGKVTVFLKGVGSKGVGVKVERGAGGEMRVVRSSGATFSASLCLLALLLHICA
ncbi:NAD(P)(+)--arginine ADP-ribosyltransferase 2-like [Hypanus sabinus]|uniref:NAD(P)(+)--arginine ADP-ribosyltransferase 2-like n=1 Tax=Hypanus sabinus TaxID=79690 RepID=UPI0028C406C2|nr:NAD(P)(+)--arginine ADP-ribosyltransferase 2-like [Hypanus sabinus]